jgi:hypothetical protein
MALVISLTDTNGGAARKYSIEVWCCNGRHLLDPAHSSQVLSFACCSCCVIRFVVSSCCLVAQPIVLLWRNAYRSQPWPVVCSQQDPDWGINISINPVSEFGICTLLEISGAQKQIRVTSLGLHEEQLRIVALRPTLKSAISHASKAVGTVPKKQQEEGKMTTTPDLTWLGGPLILCHAELGLYQSQSLPSCLITVHHVQYLSHDGTADLHVSNNDH